MSYLRFCRPLGLLAALLVLPHVCFATTAEELRHWSLVKLAECQNELDQGRQEMELGSVDTWTPAQLDNYLMFAMFTTHFAMVAYQNEYGEVPSDVTDVVAAGFLQALPGNPFEDWQPMRVLSVEDSFLPAALVYQVCPPEFYSFVEDDDLVPNSYQLSIFGPVEEYAAGSQPAPIKYNLTWAEVPKGSLAMTGLWSESGKMTLEKRAEFEQVKQDLRDAQKAEEAAKSKEVK